VSTDEQKQDRVAREAFKHRVALTAYAQALLRNRAAAEDAVQEAFVVVIKKADDFQEGTSMLAWCRSILRLEILRQRRKWAREMSLVDQLAADAITAAFDEFQKDDGARERRTKLGKCLDQLPERGRSVLRFRYTENASYTDIGERLGMTLEAVRKALFRLKRQLRVCMRTAAGEA
jgi:RNA polymerase sigma-70 factor (ECF subfamily)